MNTSLQTHEAENIVHWGENETSSKNSNENVSAVEKFPQNTITLLESNSSVDCLDCECRSFSITSQDDENLQKIVEAIEKIENKAQGDDDGESVQLTMKNVGKKLESKIKKTMKRINPTLNLKYFIQVIIDSLWVALSQSKGDLGKFPVTSAANRMFYENSFQQKIKEEVYGSSQKEHNNTTNRYYENNDNTKVEKLRSAIFKNDSSQNETEVQQKKTKYNLGILKMRLKKN